MYTTFFVMYVYCMIPFMQGTKISKIDPRFESQNSGYPCGKGQ